MEEEPEDAAAEAFEVLRAEVAGMHAELAELGPALQSAKAPDYAPTLGEMAKTLETIQAHPALRSTPAAYSAEMRSSMDALRQRLDGDLQRAFQAMAAASTDVRRFAGDLRSREQQRRWVIIAGAGGLVAGAILWAGIAGPIARAMPASWALPERMASATLRLDRWDAGSRLMQRANPAAWNELVGADQLWRTNSKALAACSRAAEIKRAAQGCSVAVGPPTPKGGTALRSHG